MAVRDVGLAQIIHFPCGGVCGSNIRKSFLGIERYFFDLYSFTWKFLRQYDFPSSSELICCTQRTTLTVPVWSATITSLFVVAYLFCLQQLNNSETMSY